MTTHYILKDKLAIPCEDLMEWAKWMSTADRTVARTDIEGLVVVSTVFLGIDHQFGEGEPLLFQTMAFEGQDYGENVAFAGSLERDSFWGHAKHDSFWVEAEESHRVACENIRQRIEQAKKDAEVVVMEVFNV